MRRQRWIVGYFGGYWFWEGLNLSGGRHWKARLILDKSHTILGSRSQRGLTQLSLDLLYCSLDQKTLHPSTSLSLVSSLSATDMSEGQILSASNFLDSVYGESLQERGNSRAPTPMMVSDSSTSLLKKPPSIGLYSQWSILGLRTASPAPGAELSFVEHTSPIICFENDSGSSKAKAIPSQLPFWHTPS